MKKQTKIIVILVILSFLLASIFALTTRFTGKMIEDNYMYTKAICNETNFCQDYEIICRGKETIEIKPITGAFVQHPEDWKDQRQESELCNGN